jgi:lysophospholipase L1-like esterase
LSLVILFLGTNDFQSMHENNAWHSAQGICALISAIKRAPIEPGMPEPEILVVSPPAIQKPKGPIAPKFEGAEHKARNLAPAIELIAAENGYPFFNAGTVTATSRVDGVHLDEDQHLALGKALAAKVREIFSESQHHLNID